MSGGWRTLLLPFASLAGSLLMSRVISVSALLIFSALAGPEPFAAFGVYFAIVGVLGVAASARYEQAIIFAGTAGEALRLSWLSVWIGAGVVGTTLVGAVLLLAGGIPLPASIQPSPLLLLAIPLSLAVRALNRIVSNLATRAASYVALSRAAWAQALVQAGVQLAMLWAGGSPIACLVVADIAGVMAATAVLAAAGDDMRRLGSRIPGPDELRQTARTWRAMPVWDLPMSLLSVAALSAPSLMLPLAYPAGLAGQLVLGMRLLELPSAILANAATPFLQRELAAAADKGAYLRRAIGLISVVSAGAFTLGAILCVMASGLFAATRWTAAVAAVPYLAPYFAGLTVSAPLVALVTGVSGERRAALAHAAFLAMTVIVGGLMAAGLGWQAALAALSLTMIARAVLFAVLLIRSAELPPARP